MKKESVPKSGTFCQKFHKIEIPEHIGIVKRRPKKKLVKLRKNLISRFFYNLTVSIADPHDILSWSGHGRVA